MSQRIKSKRRLSRSKPIPSKARSFAEDLSRLFDKYQMLDPEAPDRPEVAYVSVGNTEVKAYIRWATSPRS